MLLSLGTCRRRHIGGLIWRGRMGSREILAGAFGWTIVDQDHVVALFSPRFFPVTAFIKAVTVATDSPCSFAPCVIRATSSHRQIVPAQTSVEDLRRRPRTSTPFWKRNP